VLNVFQNAQGMFCPRFIGDTHNSMAEL
jgi:hypothetical protein